MKLSFMRQIAHLMPLLLLLSATCHAIDLRFSHLNNSNGLPQGSINALTQDRYGLLWIATQDGLVRYDGTNTYTYNTDSHKLPDNYVTLVYASPDGHLWIGSEADGASLYNYENDTIEPFNAPEIGKNILQFFPYLEDKGTLINSKNGLFLIDKQNQKTLLLTPPHNQHILNIYHQNGISYAITSRGEKLKITNKPNTPESITIWREEIQAVWHTEQCPLLIYDTNKKLTCLKENGVSSEYDIQGIFNKSGIKIENMTVVDLKEENKNRLWIATDQGLIQINDTQLSISQNITSDSHSLISNKLTTLLLSKGPTLFIGTETKGLDMLNLQTTGINYLRTTNNSYHFGKTPFNTQNKEKCGLSEADYNTIWSILKDSQGELWVGTENGLAHQAPNSHLFEDYSRLGTTELYIDVCSVKSLAETPETIWVGTKTEGLIAYSKSNHTIRQYNSEENQPTEQRLTSNNIRLLLYDRLRNSLWVGTNSAGLNRLDLTTKHITHYPFHEKENNDHHIPKEMLPHKRIRSLFLDNDNQLWIGTSSGLSRWNEKDNTFQTLFASDKITDLSDEDVRAITQIDEKHLLVATGNGLNLVHTPSFSVLKNWLAKDGLGNNTLYTVIPDKNRQFWIATGRGLSRFDLEQEHFNNFYYQDGLQDNEFNFNAWYQDNQGLIYLGGNNGLNIIDTTLAKQSDFFYSSFISSVIGYDKTGTRYDLRKITSTDNQLQTKLRNLRIHYITPAYASGQQIKSQVRLLPAQTHWTELSPASHYVDYTNLSPQEYSLQINALPNLPQTLNFKLVILPYFWETQVFYIISTAAALTLSIVFFIYFHRLRVNYALQKTTLYHLRIVEHELTPYMLHIQNQLKILLSCTYIRDLEKQKIEENITPFLNRAINFIKDLRQWIDTQRLTQSCQQYLLEDIVDEACLFFNNEQHRLDVSVADLDVLVVKSELYLVIKNLLSNALRYSPIEKPVHLIVYAKKRNLVIKCIDEGHGIPEHQRKAIYMPYLQLNKQAQQSSLGIGLGLTIVKSVVYNYRGRIWIDDNTPSGCQFNVILRGIVIDGTKTDALSNHD